jgi:glycosyltransferase involved in cell wall biosynthesis
LEICNRYAANDSRIKIINKPNGGLSSARNAGIKAAVGDYIFMLDSDDYLTENALDGAENYVDDIICFDYNSFESDSFHKVKAVYATDTKWSYVYSPIRANWTVWTKIYKRSLFNEDTFFNEKNYGTEDYEWTPLIFKNAQTVTYIEQEQVNYRTDNFSSITKTFKLRTLESFISAVKARRDCDSLMPLGVSCAKRYHISVALTAFFIKCRDVDKADFKSAKTLICENKAMLKGSSKGRISRILLSLFGFSLAVKLLNIGKSLIRGR